MDAIGGAGKAHGSENSFQLRQTMKVLIPFMTLSLSKMWRRGRHLILKSPEAACAVDSLDVGVRTGNDQYNVMNY
ncbi:hypothetical protein GZ78_03130 [Endozoicomonas numazuensis]|uniref:Uncharacterized protein n=1 Tax=Endozoicomonas numazuensis TaxID=1137799 RepID=A0A081NKR4_9GAMM|nr:hypothetical protein GZ78_03130 [Endozoicomonas numazuensis]